MMGYATDAEHDLGCGECRMPWEWHYYPVEGGVWCPVSIGFKQGDGRLRMSIYEVQRHRQAMKDTARGIN